MRNAKALLLVAIGALVIFSFLAWAGQGEKHQMTKDQLMQMKAEFSKCYVHKTMVPYMDKAWWSATGHEVHQLKDGMVSIWTVDKKDVAEFQAMCSAMKSAVEQVEKMPENEAQGKLCPMCQGMYSLLKAGAQQEWVMTQNGSLTILTAQKPETVEQIHGVAEKMGQTQQ